MQLKKARTEKEKADRIADIEMRREDTAKQNVRSSYEEYKKKPTKVAEEFEKRSIMKNKDET